MTAPIDDVFSIGDTRRVPAPADDGRTYHDPGDEAALAFEAAVDAYARAVHRHAERGPSLDAMSARDSARAALIAAHVAAVADAYALGASVERESCTCACGEPLGELCYACNDDAREIEADPPALVNGGPARDALDGGR